MLMRERPRGLWAHTNFLKFWAGQSVSLLGSTVSALALPLTAVLLLEATPAKWGCSPHSVHYQPSY
jgi:hypothetical protein